MAISNVSPGAPRIPFGGSARWSAIYGVGMLSVFSGERIIGTGGSRAFATVLGLLLILVAMVVRVLRAQSSPADRRLVERWLLALYGVGLFSLALYFVQSDLPALRGGKLLESTSPRLAGVLAALWPALWLASAWPILLVEVAYHQIARAPRLETGRVRSALLSGLGLAGALVFAFSAAYVASERDEKLDLAYFKTSRPGESTRKIARTIDSPLTMALFFPPANEVREEVLSYVNDLRKESSQIKVEQYDYDVDPAKAKEYGVSANGILVVVRGQRKEQLGLPVDFEKARSALRNLDREVQQRLLMVLKPNRTTVITEGHGERATQPGATETDKRSGIRELRDLLSDQGHDIRMQGPASGLGLDVHKDATLLMIIGPQKPFLPEELQSIKRFLDRGGKLFMALDPESGIDMKELLAPYKVTYHAEVLANDEAFARKSYQDSDRVNLVTGSYSSHPSVTTLQRLGTRAPVILPTSGWLEFPRNPDERPKEVSVDFPVRSHWSTFADKNGNFRPDQGEDKRTFDLAAAITGRKDPKGKAGEEARIFVVTDSDYLSDAVIRAAANGLLVIEPVRWLLGEEAFAGQVSTEVDAPITHTRKQDLVWFYTTIFGVPAAILGLGFFVSRRGRRTRARRSPAKVGTAIDAAKPRSDKGGAES